jgi:ETFB lysine methyltransferase
MTPVHDLSELRNDSPFEYIDGAPHYHGLPVTFRTVNVGDHSFELATLHDPAALLDLPDFARAFIEEDRAPYGLELWPSAIALANFLARHDPGHGRSALELGCGVGLVSLAAASAGWSITATDYDEAALGFTTYNVARNGVSLTAIERVDWRRPAHRPRVERILAADVLYQLVDHAPILDCLSRWLSDDGAALIADPGRGIADRFPRLAQEAGFHVDALQPTHSAVLTGNDGALPTIRIWRLSRQG